MTRVTPLSGAIWSDSETMWVFNQQKVYAFDMESGEGIPEREFRPLTDKGQTTAGRNLV